MSKLTFSQSLSTVIIVNRGRAVPFVIPVRLAQVLYWFLVCTVAQAVVLVMWELVAQTGLYLRGWQQDLQIIWIAVLLLVGARYVWQQG